MIQILGFGLFICSFSLLCINTHHLTLAFKYKNQKKTFFQTHNGVIYGKFNDDKCKEYLNKFSMYNCVGNFIIAVVLLVSMIIIKWSDNYAQLMTVVRYQCSYSLISVAINGLIMRFIK